MPSARGKRTYEPPSVSPPDTEVAWAAGFFEGEGTVYAARNREGRTYCSLVVGNTDTECLERFQRVMGGGIYSIPQKNEYAKKPFFMWKSSNRAIVLRALNLMWPYLSTRRQEQTKKVQSAVAMNPPRRHRWTGLNAEQRKVEHAKGRTEV